MDEVLTFVSHFTAGSWTTFTNLVLWALALVLIWWKGLPVFITAKSTAEGLLRDHYDRELRLLAKRLGACEEKHEECEENFDALRKQFRQFQRSVVRALPHSVELEASIKALDMIEEKDDELS